MHRNTRTKQEKCNNSMQTSLFSSTNIATLIYSVNDQTTLTNTLI